MIYWDQRLSNDLTNASNCSRENIEPQTHDYLFDNDSLVK